MDIVEIVSKIIEGLNRIYDKGYQDGSLQRKKKSRRRAFTKKTKQAVLLLQGFRCRSCGCITGVYEFDHIDGNKANNRSNNCQALCPNCHARKTRKK